MFGRLFVHLRINIVWICNNVYGFPHWKLFRWGQILFWMKKITSSIYKNITGPTVQLIFLLGFLPSHVQMCQWIVTIPAAQGKVKWCFRTLAEPQPHHPLKSNVLLSSRPPHAKNSSMTTEIKQQIIIVTWHFKDTHCNHMRFNNRTKKKGRMWKTLRHEDASGGVAPLCTHVKTTKCFMW